MGRVGLGLSKPPRGIHGTGEPGQMSRMETNGCVRLTNWDVLRLVELAGYVASSGNAGDSRTCTCAVFRLGPQRRWWEGDPVNPYPAVRRACGRLTRG